MIEYIIIFDMKFIFLIDKYSELAAAYWLLLNARVDTTHILQ